MNIETLEALGFSKEDILDRVVAKIADQFLYTEATDENGEAVYGIKSSAARNLDELIRARLDAKVKELAETHVMPILNSKVENLVLQETNRWGEKVGKKMTLNEYLVSRAEAYMLEPVNYNGKTRAEDGYSFSACSTRIDYAIDQYLRHSISIAMEKVIKEGNKALVGGLVETCKLKLGEIASALKVEVKTK